MTEEQAKQFMAVQKLILQRVSVSEGILIAFASVVGLILIGMIIGIVFM